MTQAIQAPSLPATSLPAVARCVSCALPSLRSDSRCLMHAAIAHAKAIARQERNDRRARRRAVSLGLRISERARLAPRPHHWDLAPKSPAKLALDAMASILQSLAARTVRRSHEYRTPCQAEARAAVALHARHRLLDVRGTVHARDYDRRFAQRVVAENNARIDAAIAGDPRS